MNCTGGFFFVVAGKLAMAGGLALEELAEGARTGAARPCPDCFLLHGRIFNLQQEEGYMAEKEGAGRDAAAQGHSAARRDREDGSPGRRARVHPRRDARLAGLGRDLGPGRGRGRDQARCTGRRS
ncbi:hypothetical protein Zm00014a_029810 [Zea mays]|uniref:Uncharacterized protein n=1 Tax=Zea mays TaxID=4577 RepID=A0A3L6EMW1_MAIZE|nr:hypothetical protein Zm00014a_029810 [Zea mays]